MLDHLSRTVATRPAQPLPRLQPSPLPTLLRGRRAVGEHLDAVGSEDVRREVQQRQRRVLAKCTDGSQLSQHCEDMNVVAALTWIGFEQSVPHRAAGYPAFPQGGMLTDG